MMTNELKLFIEKISWGDRKTVTGNAGQVPMALCDLTSPDTEVRNRAYWKLDNQGILQGDLYDSSYDVAVCLVRMLQEHPTHGIDRIYDLLIEIANGFAPAELKFTLE